MLKGHSLGELCALTDCGRAKAALGTSGSGGLSVPAVALCEVYSVQSIPTGAGRSPEKVIAGLFLFGTHFRISKWVALNYDQGAFQTVAFSRGF